VEQKQRRIVRRTENPDRYRDCRAGYHELWDREPCDEGGGPIHGDRTPDGITGPSGLSMMLVARHVLSQRNVREEIGMGVDCQPMANHETEAHGEHRVPPEGSAGRTPPHRA